MQKEFDKWNENKKNIHNRAVAPFFHEREIWWCNLGVNIGFEQDGSGESYLRPVLIIKAMSKQTCFVIPLTTSANQHELRPSIGVVEDKQARALLSQMRLIDSKRLVRKSEYLDKTIFDNIRKTVKNMF